MGIKLGMQLKGKARNKLQLSVLLHSVPIIFTNSVVNRASLLTIIRMNYFDLFMKRFKVNFGCEFIILHLEFIDLMI